MDVQAALREEGLSICPWWCFKGDIQRSRVTHVCYPMPNTSPDSLALDHKDARNPPADTDSSSARRECGWQCKDLKGVTSMSLPWKYSQVLPSEIDRTKPFFWVGFTPKCVFQIQCWNFLRRPQFSQLRWTLVSVLQYLSFSFTKGRVLKQHHMSLEKSGGVTGGEWGAWSCREDICAQRCVKFHKTQCNPQVPCGPPSCMARNPFISHGFVHTLCVLQLLQLFCFPSWFAWDQVTESKGLGQNLNKSSFKFKKKKEEKNPTCRETPSPMRDFDLEAFLQEIQGYLEPWLALPRCLRWVRFGYLCKERDKERNFSKSEYFRS